MKPRHLLGAYVQALLISTPRKRKMGREVKRSTGAVDVSEVSHERLAEFKLGKALVPDEFRMSKRSSPNERLEGNYS